MKISPRHLVGPMVGAFVLVMVVQQTLGALKVSGAWQPEVRAAVRVESPYALLDQVLSRTARTSAPEALRDPFAYGSAPAPLAVVPSTTPRPRPVPPPPSQVAQVQPARPMLTSIVWEPNDPRATIRYDGRDFSVRENSLFADFTVRSIRQNEVVLDRSGQAIVLTLRQRGDTR